MRAVNGITKRPTRRKMRIIENMSASMTFAFEGLLIGKMHKSWEAWDTRGCGSRKAVTCETSAAW